MPPKRSVSLAGIYGDPSTPIEINTRKVLVARWMSATGEDVTTDAAFRLELQKLGQATTTLPQKDSVYDFVGGVPYTTKLRSLREWRKYVTDSKASVFLRSLFFTAIDTTLENSAWQDTDTVDEIITPTNANDLYVRSQFRNTEVPTTWYPNYLNPEFVVGGINILSNSAVLDKLHASDIGRLGAGMTLPLELVDIYYEIKGAQNIDVFACVLQFIEETSKYQRYPVICEAEFLI